MSQPAREYFSARVSGDQLEDVLAQLLAPEFSLPESLRAEAILLSGRLTGLNEQVRSNTLAPEEVARERNRIRESLLLLVSGLPPGLLISPALARSEKRLRYRWAAALGLYLLIAGSAIYFLFQPKKTLRIEGELSMERFSFTHERGSYDFEGMDIAQARITDYRRLEAEADSLRVDAGMKGTARAYPLSGGVLRIESLPDIPGLGVNLLTPVRLHALDLPQGALVTLERLSGAGAPARLIFEHIDSIMCVFSYLAQADLQTEEVRIQGIPGPEEWAEPTSLRLYGASSSRREIRFHSVPGLFGLELFPRDSLPIGGKSLLVSDPTFFRKQGDVVRPTIRGGTLIFQEAGRPPMQTLTIREGEPLALTGDQALDIRQLTLTAEGIRITFSAQIDRVETGAYFELRNPLRIEWYWHNQRLLLIVVGLGVFGLIFFLPGPLREQVMDFVRHMRGAKP